MLVSEAVALRDGPCVFVQLAGVTDATKVDSLVAAAIGATGPGPGPARDRILARLLGRAELLVLDDCEHVREACADLVSALVAARPQARVIVTGLQQLQV